ncbi:MAG: aminotransferase class IV family protein [Acidimicrobiia bacterium]|nr:aminotransferase class IV family protein [Acidimicrobiia bacterium]
MHAAPETSGAPIAVWVNGTLFSDREPTRPVAAACVPALGFGHLYGDGVFETVRVHAGRPLLLDDHVARLMQGVALIGLKGMPPPRDIVTAVEHTLAAGLPGEDGVVRMTATRGTPAPGTFFDPTACSTCDVVISAVPLPRLELHPAHAVCVGVRHPAALPPPTLKSTSYQGALLGLGVARAAGADTGLWTDGSGNVTEALTANVFAVGNDVLFTPPDDVCLPGLTRRTVLELAHGAGIPCEVAHLPLARAGLWSEAFLTSSVTGIRPLASIEGSALPHAPGPVTRRLTAAYGRYVQEACT